ncbi:hypothetical protein [Streptomyces sp. NPDC097981]|uniref:hypothetical protein n=1 Tax=Streptomyces sp. NPDC097981 TaxID=3155428 RepID=UPI00332B9E79
MAYLTRRALSWQANPVVVVACVVPLTGGTPPVHHGTPSTAAVAAMPAIGVGLVLFGGHVWVLCTRWHDWAAPAWPRGREPALARVLR